MLADPILADLLIVFEVFYYDSYNLVVSTSLEWVVTIFDSGKCSSVNKMAGATWFTRISFKKDSCFDSGKCSSVNKMAGATWFARCSFKKDSCGIGSCTDFKSKWLTSGGFFFELQ